ncbi:uncharacterized protein MONBRDRAFT_23774 [Monosiga brevicollis MX1]|uniref:SH3 domain-containing protein n=1 Tax=Monosiga brevicollis TaxID=81824 RepID=A9UUT1_MONBE|nr:uncharacterized protein MONBRDRAFT_23774 [Monosiga brevicollis MX1]EDQ90774.1 predicted protein [Monosiga brevicollis MX1]|eukprot:XP_001744071.1 hypothetical protein [Monosiga brevicollis MX1]
MLQSFLGLKGAPELVAVTLALPDGAAVTVEVSKNATISDVLPLLDREVQLPERLFFGLLAPKDTEKHFLDPNDSLRKVLGQPVAEVETTTGRLGRKHWRLQLQLRYHPPAVVMREWSPMGKTWLLHSLLAELLAARLQVMQDVAVSLGALAAQVLAGDYEESRHADAQYLRSMRVQPDQDERLTRAIQHRHASHSGMITSANALDEFLNLCCEQELYGVGRLFETAPTPDREIQQVGCSARGVHVYAHDQRVVIYGWSRIQRMHYRSKNFEITLKTPPSEFEPTDFFFATSALCKAVWSHCVERHAFYRIRNTSLRGDVQGVPIGATMFEASRIARRNSKMLEQASLDEARRRSSNWTSSTGSFESHVSLDSLIRGAEGEAIRRASAAPSKNVARTPSFAVAIVAFEPQGDRDLAFRPGQVVRLTKTDEHDWWWGAIGPQSGRFPSRCVTRLDQDLSRLVKAKRDHQGEMSFPAGAILSLEETSRDVPAGMLFGRFGSRTGLFPQDVVASLAPTTKPLSQPLTQQVII